MLVLILLFVSLVLFVLGTINPPTSRFNLVAAGLAFYVASILIDRLLT
ncbi:hypothetical protein P0D88_31405 [Paraburkholderia sp. RL18-103-BIB-C]